MQRELGYRACLVDYGGRREREKGEGEEGKRGRSCIFREKGGGGSKIHLPWWRGRLGVGGTYLFKGQSTQVKDQAIRLQINFFMKYQSEKKANILYT